MDKDHARFLEQRDLATWRSWAARQQKTTVFITDPPFSLEFDFSIEELAEMLADPGWECQHCGAPGPFTVDGWLKHLAAH